jgi:septum formation protein
MSLPAVKKNPNANPCFCSTNVPTSLILASGSRYRRQLLERFRLPFHVYAADTDESARPNESPQELVGRLATAKARSVAALFPNACVIGADQVAVCRERVVGKPGSPAQAVEQLRSASGQRVTFLTAVCLLRESDGHRDEHLDTTVVHFRELSEGEITRYIEIEQPLDCAGSFKSEGLGIALFERIESRDPTALIGLPLIWLATALRRAGMPPL